jgi:hypothetical protein
MQQPIPLIGNIGFAIYAHIGGLSLHSSIVLTLCSLYTAPIRLGGRTFQNTPQKMSPPSSNEKNSFKTLVKSFCSLFSFVDGFMNSFIFSVCFLLSFVAWLFLSLSFFLVYFRSLHRIPSSEPVKTVDFVLFFHL